MILFGFFFYKYSSDLSPLKNKNKISIKQVKDFTKNNYVLLLFGLILKYRKNKSAKGSYEPII